MTTLSVTTTGRQVACCVKQQAAFQTSVASTLAATDSVPIVSYKFDPKREQDERNDKRSTRSALEEIQGNQEVDWNIKKYIIPAGGGAVNPDDADLLAALFGKDGTSGAYTLSDAHISHPVLTIGCVDNATWGEWIIGAWCDEGNIDLSNGEHPMIEYIGKAYDHIRCGYCTAGTGATSADVPLSEARASRSFDVGGIISVGSNDGCLISSIDHATNTLTLSSSITFGTGDVVRPYSPYSEANISGNPGTKCTCSLAAGDSSDQLYQGATIKIANSWHELRGPNNYRPSDVQPGDRKVTGEVTMFGRAIDIRRLLTAAKHFDIDSAPYNTSASVNPLRLVWVVTAPSGTCTITVPKASFSLAGLEGAEDGPATYKLPFRALATAYDQLDEIDFAYA